MSLSRAHTILEDMIEVEHAPTEDAALRSISQRCGVGFWTLHNIHRGRAKSIKDSIFARLNGAYLDLCRRQLDRWRHQLNVAEATGDDAFHDLREALADMEARLADARAAQLAHHHRDDRGRVSDRDFLTGANSPSFPTRR